MGPRDTVRAAARRQQREHVLLAARDVFGARGYEASSMDDIAARAGVTKPIVYRHFLGKHELYLTLLESSAADVVNAVQTSLASGHDNRTRVAAVIDAFFRLIEDDDASFRLIIQSDVSDRDVREQVEAVEARSIQLIARLIRDQAHASQDEALLLAAALVGMTRTAARFWAGAGERASRERTIEILSQVIWQGLGGFSRR